jgi:hypothetical protein
MKKNILIALITIIIIVALVYSKIQPERSFISFEYKCIETNGSINDVVDKTVAEFPECSVITSGDFMESDFIYVRCGNAALNTSDFVTFKNRDACDTFSGMDLFQQKNIISKQSLPGK